MRQLPIGEHNIDEFSPPAGVPDIISACSTAPFLCEKRMVIVRGIVSQAVRSPGARSRRSGGGGTAPRGEASGAAGALADYLPHLPATTHLVLVEEDARPLEPILRAAPGAVRQEFSLLRPDALPSWIRDRARRRGARITPRAADELAELVGSDLRALDQELSKLTTYVDAAGTIDQADLRQLVSGAGPDVFTFHDAVGERRGAAALGAARSLLTRGMEPAELFAHLAGLVRRLLIVKEMVAERRPIGPEAASFGLSTSPYIQGKLQRQALNFSSTELEGAFALLRDADIAIKTGRIDSELAVELAVAQIVGIAAADRSGIAHPERGSPRGAAA